MNSNETGKVRTGAEARGAGTVGMYAYLNDSYSKVEGKSAEQLKDELRAVYDAYPEYNDPEHGGTGFEAMVVKFAGDEFYNLHYVARRYSELRFSHDRTRFGLADRKIRPSESVSGGLESALFVGDEAVKRLGILLELFFQDDSTGKAYGVQRAADGLLRMIGFTGCGIQRVAEDLAESTGLARYEMIVIDFVNSDGDRWKAAYHPRQIVLSFIKEA